MIITHSKPQITEKDRLAVDNILQRGLIAKGSKVREFEKELADYLGTKETITTGSGTAALILALKALKIGNGSEVILPTYVCKSVFQAIKVVGAIPVVCDIGAEWNMTLDNVAQHISQHTKAIILVHIFGIPVDTEKFKIFNVPIIEDCCQAFGATVNGKKVGSFGTFSIFSFHATKCLTTGEGGAVTSNDEEIIDRLKDLIGLNAVPSSLTDLQAALGLSQIDRYQTMLNKREEIARCYFRELSDLEIALPYHIKNKSIFFRFPLRVKNEGFAKLQNAFNKRGIQVRRGVDALLHRNIDIPDSEFPTAIRLFHETISLPIYPALGDGELNKIIETTKSVFR